MMPSPDPVANAVAVDPFAALIDASRPFPNVRGTPLWATPRPLTPKQMEAITVLHRRMRAERHLADYAAYCLDVIPAAHHKLICEAIDALLNDEYDELIILTPPGAAKSTYTSHGLGAYFMGRFPTRNVILATHTAELSERWSRRVRNTLIDDRHAQVFPQSELSKDSTAVGRWATSMGGEFLAAGVGASILGFRADCLVGNTLLTTRTGYTPISAIVPGDEVLAYDESQLSTGYHRVVAVAERTTDITYRIHTTDGRMVEATGNHPFYVGGRFIPADSIVVGDVLLSSVQFNKDSSGFDNGEDAFPITVGEGVLFKELRQHPYPTPYCPKLCCVRSDVPSTPKDNKILFPRLFSVVKKTARQIVRKLWKTVQTTQLQVGILLNRLQKCSPFTTDEGNGQPELATRQKSEQISRRQRASIQGGAKNGTVHGQWRMCDLFEHGEPARASCGRRFDQQCPDQYRYTLSEVPHDTTWCGAGKTAEVSVARIEVIRGKQTVFDIQVEHTANFFANGVLVHNCVIIDDPIAGFEEAQSLTQLKKIHSWYETDLVTRLKPGGKTVCICQRLARNDLAGYLIDRNELNQTKRQRVLRLRMEAEAGEVDPLGRAPGERLWPEWFTEQMVADAKRDEFKWRTLYQQEPPSDTGSWVSKEEIQFRPSPPVTPESSLYGMTDLALSVNTGDYTVHFVVAIDEKGDWDVIDASRRRVDPEQSSNAIINFCSSYNIREWLIDDDNASRVLVPLVATAARQAGVMVPWRPMPMRGQDKETRAAPLRGQFKRRKVYMPADAPFTRWLVTELLTFPNAMGEGVDDGVDALALLGRRLMSLSHQAPAPAAAPKPKTWQDVTLNEMWEDRENSRRFTRRI